MKAPNEELIAELQQLANEIEISYRIESIEEAVKALQSQEERIAELERESETHAKAYGLAIVERDNLRTELKTAQDVTELVEALEEYGRAGVGNSTDWRVQLSALRLATAALSKYKGAK